MPPNGRIAHEWAHAFGHLLADFWDLAYALKRGEAYLCNVSWADAKADEDRRRRTLGGAWHRFRDRARAVEADAAQLERLEALMEDGAEQDGLLRVRNAVAHGLWRTASPDKSVYQNLSDPR